MPGFQYRAFSEFAKGYLLTTASRLGGDNTTEVRVLFVVTNTFKMQLFLRGFANCRYPPISVID